MRSLSSQKAAPRLYEEVVPLWIDAGASSLQAFGVILEMLAVVKCAGSGQGSLFALPAKELNLQVWRDLGLQLSRTLRLPNAFDVTAAWSTPGLLEHTKRAIIAVATLTDYCWRDLAIALLHKVADEETRGRKGPRAISSWLELLPERLHKAMQPARRARQLRSSRTASRCRSVWPLAGRRARKPAPERI
jgi:hypothetical protein